ncbi:thiosulfate oxidation carrier protein SoxY [Pseudorhodobacter sp. E13]|uniref:thiosulfate oxidation carrier protein SoxY n=1 Tax=Pseudorhodobacter sp. E13 TaxID=2487931 RepID=UPI000F8EADBA|nr:thiosulfate oxidation carrier protein SoxY [Pseudorhodobacter sp. E13]RUS59644.1 thiosulfate oxidation carrier protein SoxY [Pseudorhodobacter sp. E13]
MILSRREALVLALGSVAAAAIPLPALASVEEAVAAFTGGAAVTDGAGVTLTAPEIAENGNTVPVSVDAPGASAIMVLAAGNPTPAVATFTFGELAGAHMASTRIRLSKTQDVIAIAKLADGSFVRTSSEVKVTIGGCGG